MQEDDYYKWGDVVVGECQGVGHTQNGKRFLVIVSNNVGNKYAPIYNVIPFTTKQKNVQQKTHVLFKAGECGLERDSMLLAEQQMPIDKKNIIKKAGEMTDEQRRKVATAMAFASPIVLLFASDIIDEPDFIKVATV